MTMNTSSCLEIAQALVRIPSVNPTFDPGGPGEREIVPWLREWGLRQGLDTSVHEVVDGRSNVVFQFKNGADHPHLLLNGHIDTVGVAGMRNPPFEGRISEGRLWGRGATDMKGAVACMMAALLELRRQADLWRGTVTVGCVADEEHRFRGILELMEQMPRPDFAIVGEPTSMRVIRGCKGCLRFSIRALGRAAHSSNPGAGVNAIVAMSDAVLVLEDFFRGELARHSLPEFGASTGSVSIVEGGTGINIVPESCRLDVDIRLLPGQDWKKTYQDLQDFVRTRAIRVPGIKWEFDEPMLVDLSMNVPADSVLVKKALARTGAAQADVVAYGCDASKVAAKGVPCIIMGPGDIAHAHTVDEAISVHDLEQATAVYIQLTKDLLPC